MQTDHYRLWARCRDFVRATCVGRDASHGLAHMEKVTENSVLIFSMQCVDGCCNENMEEKSVNLARIILVAMLHDVSDHKYDADGRLALRVEEFIRQEATQVPVAAAALGTAEHCQHALRTMEAISFSTEKRRGRRWFAAELPHSWLGVRDVVSDADKLEAIGHVGLRRCLQHTLHTLQLTEEEMLQSKEKLQLCLRRVRDHFDEKLSLLCTEFIVTEAGKFLAGPRHTEMVETLHVWETEGVPRLPIC
ncbi:hypothetical protein ERJ75_001447700 [Trypanosoma vivax]|uniref:HD domain-containing protein n=1 Tax=Trypanosoma vivax (strain Y486) TaxID=1055687 RepID=G0U823_TRYVY|nr:hypothetical protein TRVL_06014 [Trypanosoma vivax]KAH8607195.1 hypothetical protein ERJ75_001447700 [Trypanosoma vivax]CCC52032.1 conserved hypothetical protein [Trypanosoma vivax Y486]